MQVLQQSCFPKEIHDLKKNKYVDKGSRLYNLDPFIDDYGLIRVGGRLENAKISYEKRHQIIIHNSHFITDSIINYYHLTYCHAGAHTILYAIRQKYWIIDGRNQIKKVIRKCIMCFRAEPRLAVYKMGQLPTARVNRSRPFNHAGVDYCGPFYIKERKYRNQKKIKVYVSVFVCMAVKAIHFELVSDLTTESYIGALKRFISRRGKPVSIYSDNAKNFQGAKNELNELYTLFQTEHFKSNVFNFSSSNSIEFHFTVKPH